MKGIKTFSDLYEHEVFMDFGFVVSELLDFIHIKEEKLKTITYSKYVRLSTSLESDIEEHFTKVEKLKSEKFVGEYYFFSNFLADPILLVLVKCINKNGKIETKCFMYEK